MKVCWAAPDLKPLLFALLLLAVSANAGESLTGIPRVVDEDTFVIKGERIRLKGIDAPESKQRCQGGSGNWYPCGQRSTEYLRDRIAGKPVSCQLDPERDRYGRALGTCFTSDGTNLQAWLVRNGLALAYRRYSMRYVNEEVAAQASRSGMWNGEFIPPWRWRKGERLN